MLGKSALISSVVALGLAASTLGAAAQYRAAAGTGGFSNANASGGAVAVGDNIAFDNSIDPFFFDPIFD